MKTLKNFMIKEGKEELRSFLINFLALACMCIIQQYLVLGRFKNLFEGVGSNKVEFMTQMINLSLVSLSIICITFMSNSTMNRSIQKEKKNKSIIILISLGISAKDIWHSKTYLSFIVGYIAYTLILILDILMIKIVFKLPMVLSLKGIITYMIIGPIISYSLVLILSFLFWYFKNNMIITLIYTMSLTFGTWIFMTMVSSPILVNNIYIPVIILVPLVLNYVFAKIIGKQEKWKLGLS
ncbi:hypothetical protein GCM10008908_25020 [Clostridium subterminale]|uniref:ABC transporter permease n=1 Tax=Clostridium subterminale TaxID=1550 RepID=A0ABP3W4L9_CLOSU